MCSAATVCLSHCDSQSMKFVEQPGVSHLCIRSKCPPSEICQCVIALQAGAIRKKVVTLSDAAEILVGYWNRKAEGIEQDGVGSLRAYARQGQ